MKLHLIVSAENAHQDCVSFASDERDAQTLVFCYLSQCTEIQSATIVRGSRVAIIDLSAGCDISAVRNSVSSLYRAI